MHIHVTKQANEYIAQARKSLIIRKIENTTYFFYIDKAIESRLYIKPIILCSYYY